MATMVKPKLKKTRYKKKPQPVMVKVEDFEHISSTSKTDETQKTKTLVDNSITDSPVMKTRYKKKPQPVMVKVEDFEHISSTYKTVETQKTKTLVDNSITDSPVMISNQSSPISNIEVVSPSVAVDSSFEEVQKTPKSVPTSSKTIYRNPTTLKSIEAIRPAESKPIVNTALPTMKLKYEDIERIFCGEEMARMNVISSEEERILNIWSESSHNHPLLELLQDLKSSLTAVERESTKIEQNYVEEEKFRNSLWKVEKKQKILSEKCPCGSDVHVKIRFEHAELQKEKMQVAKLKLESLWKDIREGYCHYQYSALTAHWEIEQLVYEISLSNKSDIRLALIVLFNEMKFCDLSCVVYCGALQRWAMALIHALLDYDPRHLFFVMHNLFRQSNAVGWAMRLLKVPSDSHADVARAIALLKITLTRNNFNYNQDQEEMTESWNEVDTGGSVAAVASNRMRENDMLSLFNVFPWTDIIAQLVLLKKRNIPDMYEADWGDRFAGEGVLKCLYGLNVLLKSLNQIVESNQSYKRLIECVYEVASCACWCVSDFDLKCRLWYSPSVVGLIDDQLSVVVNHAFVIWTSVKELTPNLPFRYLNIKLAEKLLQAVIEMYDSQHVTQPDQTDCEVKLYLKAICMMATDILNRGFAKSVAQFLFKIGVKYKKICKDSCHLEAQALLPTIISAYPDMYVEKLIEMATDTDSQKEHFTILGLDKWRPQPKELLDVLYEYHAKCLKLVPHLILAMDFAPQSGVQLESQLSLANWLIKLPVDEWQWTVLLRLSLHRVWWGLCLNAPSPDFEPTIPLHHAYLLLATSHGHSLPLICEFGVYSLEQLVLNDRIRAAVHCLAPLVVVLAQSPDSLAYTPKFGETVRALCSIPSLLNRLLKSQDDRRALMLKLILGQLTDHRKRAYIEQPSILATWMHSLWEDNEYSHELIETMAKVVPEDMFNDVVATMPKVSWRSSGRFPRLWFALRKTYLREDPSESIWNKLKADLILQMVQGHKINVDYAIKKSDSNLSSDDLLIYKCLEAATIAPAMDIASCNIWHMFCNLYLDKGSIQTPSKITKTSGPLFFKGFRNSRKLTLLKWCLNAQISQHDAEITRITQKEKKPPPPPVTRTKLDRLNSSKENLLLPSLELKDLNGCDTDNEEEIPVLSGCSKVDNSNDLVLFHETMKRNKSKVINWLEDENVEAMVTDSDLLFGKCKEELKKLKAVWPDMPIIEDNVEFTPLPNVRSDECSLMGNAFERVKYRLNNCVWDQRRKSIKEPKLQPLVTGSTLTDPYSLLQALDNNLRDVETFMKEFSSQIRRLQELDKYLWQQVVQLRVKKAIPPIVRSCAHRCKAITLAVHADEWCISTKAENAIAENRANSRELLRLITKPRPHTVQNSATVQILLRYVRDHSTAVKVLKMLWRSGESKYIDQWLAVNNQLVELVKNHITTDANTSCSLISDWSKCLSLTSFRLSLLSKVVTPTALANNSWPSVYCAIVRSKLPAHVAFSFLSKFNIDALSKQSTPNQREEVLRALIETIKSQGVISEQTDMMRAELLESQLCALTGPLELPLLLVELNRAVLENSLSPEAWTRLKPVLRHAEDMQFDLLCHIVHELGVLWSFARSRLQSPLARLALHSTHLAHVLRAMANSIVNVASRQYFAKYKVAQYACSLALESWGPWVRPLNESVLLLPTGDESSTHFIQQFIQTIQEIIELCPGSEGQILCDVYEWTHQTIIPLKGHQPSENKVQLSLLLSEEKRLPWQDYQWLNPNVVKTMVLLGSISMSEVSSWVSFICSAQSSTSWMKDVAPSYLAPHLAHVLYVFIMLPMEDKCISQACVLPWCHLPFPALEEAFRGFLTKHHSTQKAYHQANCFTLLLCASELSLNSFEYVNNPNAIQKRCIAITLWSQAVCAQDLIQFVSASTTQLLSVLVALAPLIESNENELVELMRRVMTIMCMEPSGSASVGAWIIFLPLMPLSIRSACISALTSLTNFEHYATLLDKAVQLNLAQEGPPLFDVWQDITSRLNGSHWNRTLELIKLHRLHGAYATAITFQSNQVPNFSALEVNFIENETILCAWACYLCRISVNCKSSEAESVLLEWANAAKASFIRVLSFQAQSDVPTDKLKLLCRYALCVIRRDEKRESQVQSSCAKFWIPIPPDVTEWMKNYKLINMPRLAIKLFPKNEVYFSHELRCS